jgi:hypothetical protein
MSRVRRVVAVFDSMRVELVQTMKRLLQLGTLMLLIGVCMPIQEIFDCWDEPGIANDSEFAFFAFAVAFCLVLLVCFLIAAGVLKVYLLSLRAMLSAETAEHSEAGHTFIFVVPPLQLVPLRI